MNIMSYKRPLVMAALLAISPAAAIAQEDVQERVEDLSAQANEVQQEATALANDLAVEDNAAGTVEDDGAAGTEEGDRATGREEDRDSGKWGLLGLLGLAGLLGLRRRNDRHAHADVHRDGRL